jgi:hypothetical protein
MLAPVLIDVIYNAGDPDAIDCAFRSRASRQLHSRASPSCDICFQITYVPNIWSIKLETICHKFPRLFPYRCHP